MHIEVGSWIANTKDKQFFDDRVLGRITLLFKDYNYMNEEEHITIT